MHLPLQHASLPRSMAHTYQQNIEHIEHQPCISTTLPFVMMLLVLKPAWLLLTGLHEVWEDGQAFRDLQVRMKALAENRSSIEAARKVCTTQS